MFQCPSSSFYLNCPSSPPNPLLFPFLPWLGHFPSRSHSRFSLLFYHCHHSCFQNHLFPCRPFLFHGHLLFLFLFCFCHFSTCASFSSANSSFSAACVIVFAITIACAYSLNVFCSCACVMSTPVSSHSTCDSAVASAYGFALPKIMINKT